MSKKSCITESYTDVEKTKRSVSIWMDIETMEEIEEVIARMKLNKIKNAPKNRNQLIIEAINKYLEECKK